MIQKLKQLHKEGSTGFTIIEVMIVLTVAALIMLIVFLAIPQLNRNQRNTRRKDIINRVKAEVENYASNNGGSLPTADANASTGFSNGGGFYNRYVAGLGFKDPSNSATNMAFTGKGVGAATGTGTVNYSTPAVCSGDAAPIAASGGYVVYVALEGGTGLTYCVDSQ